MKKEAKTERKKKGDREKQTQGIKRIERKVEQKKNTIKEKTKEDQRVIK